MSVWPAALTWGQLGVLCGRKARGGSFNTARKQIHLGGLAIEEDDLVRLRESALEHFGEERPSAPQSEAEMVSRMVEALPTPAKDILAEIAKSAPVRTEELGIRLGRATRGGSWNTGMAMLKANDLIHETSGGWVLNRFRCVQV
jgi:hypothetical protein